MSEWKEKNLSKIAFINPTESISKGKEAKKVAMENLQPFTKSISGYSTDEYKGGSKFRNGDTLVARITPSLENGKTAFVDILNDGEVGFGSTEFIVLREKEGVSDKEFLYYLALSPEFREIAILSMTGSSGRQRVQTDVVENHEFLIPSLPKQKAIASVLSSLDDKIDLLYRQNQTLEAMAETLFRQWFVEEAGEDWKYEELGNIIETTSGGTPSRKKMEYFQGGVFPWIKSKELTRTFILTTEEKITDEALKNSSAKILPNHSIIIAMYGATVGEYAITTGEMTCNQAICALKPNDKFPYTFLFIFIKYMRGELINMTVGSAQQNISQKLIKTLLIPLAHDKISAFHESTESLFKRIQRNLKQIKTLEKLRDTLLPKLMNGEVRINIKKRSYGKRGSNTAYISRNT